VVMVVGQGRKLIRRGKVVEWERDATRVVCLPRFCPAGDFTPSELKYPISRQDSLRHATDWRI
jgi:hypothetical protein